MIKTVLCDLLGIRYPLFQGGMAWVSDAVLAAAVSEAGGLGIIAAGHAPADYVREQIVKARELTDKPFGVNIMLMSPHVDEVAQVLADEKVSLVVTGAGNPVKYMEKWLAAGCRVIPVVASSALAKMMERCGATAVIAEGGESGGHIGELTTMALMPQVCDAVTIPVLAAGGIADGRGIAAAFMLGACGVQVGTRFLVAKECTIHQNFKDMVIKAKDIDTIVTGRRLGHPVRALKNAFTREYLKQEYDSNVTDDELEQLGVGTLRLAIFDGDVRGGTFLAGQVSGMIKREQTAAEIITEMFIQAEEILKGAGQWIR
jgi:enoyl-[acyl-carrier protein] reductase II